MYRAIFTPNKNKENITYLDECTVRGFKKRYEAKLKEASRKNVSPKKKLANEMRGRQRYLVENLTHLCKSSQDLRDTRMVS